MGGGGRRWEYVGKSRRAEGKKKEWKQQLRRAAASLCLVCDDKWDGEGRMKQSCDGRATGMRCGSESSEPLADLVSSLCCSCSR